MITRTHQKGDAASVAVYSDCERYRYALSRVWDETGPRVLFIMLNPSKATERQNDPTIERIVTSWPAEVASERAAGIGFAADKPFIEAVRDFAATVNGG